MVTGLQEFEKTPELKLGNASVMLRRVFSLCILLTFDKLP